MSALTGSLVTATPEAASSQTFVALLDWYDRHGRKDLPWQIDRTPYRVWVSEIMLQQTQVATVIPYYNAFMQRFPDVSALAAAPIDEVLHLWSGLGYYARGRNLHRAALLIVERHAGVFPTTLDAAMELPGIGRSTAGAILALSRDERHSILDGNVRRVLSRYFLLPDPPGRAEATRRLWELADRCTPRERPAAYTQAIMDLGATVCVRTRPLCSACPLAEGCAARRSGRQHEFPVARPRPARRLQVTWMLIVVRDGQVLLERRPPNGIWGGLWGLPEFPNTEAARIWCAGQFADAPPSFQTLAPLHHAFTHFDLEIRPLLVRGAAPTAVMEPGRWLWYDRHAPAQLGLPAPVQTLIRIGTDPLSSK